eukprot:766896-Hanusia_phi.AAC.5
MGKGGAGKGNMENLTRSSSVSAKAQLLSQDDQKRVVSLETKVAEQKKEIENRDITIKAIQRNFEQLSTLCQQDKEQLQKLQKKLAEAESRAADDETRRKAEKYPQLKEAFDSLNQSYVEAEAKVETFRRETAELSSRLQNLESVKTSLTQEVLDQIYVRGVRGGRWRQENEVCRRRRLCSASLSPAPRREEELTGSRVL